MKKTLSLLLTALLITACFAPAVGAVNVILNSSFLKFPDQEPVIENGTTLVPIRAISEALGLSVTWDEANRLVTLKNGSFFIELTIGSTKAVTSSGEKSLSQPPMIINGRTVVPLRFIAEAMGLTVLWNDEYQRVIINGNINTASEKPSEAPSENETAVSTPSLQPSAEKGTEPPVEDETEVTEDTALMTVTSPSGSIVFEIPADFTYEDTSDEQSFAFRSNDATDMQHSYAWDSVVLHESYADSDGINGIIVISEEYEPYNGPDVDMSRINEEYPEPPVKPDIDWPTVMMTAEMMIMESIFAERNVEMPENLTDMEDAEIAELLGFETVEEYEEYSRAAAESFDMSVIPEYAQQQEYMQEHYDYTIALRELQQIKRNAQRNFSSLAPQATDAEWAALFSSELNSDPEVRYDGVEILTINDKKVVHGVIYAEDTDDEQGTYDYYLYYDGDTRITIYGGTLSSSEPSPVVCDVLSRMTIN